MFFSRTALIAATLMGVAPTIAMAQPAPQVVQNAPKKAKKGLFSDYFYTPPMLYGRKGAGISMAQQKRTAIKAKNKRKNRR